MAAGGGNLVASGGHHYDRERGKCYPIPFNLGLINLERVQRIPKLSHLVFTDSVNCNPIKCILPDDRTIESLTYGVARFRGHVKVLDEIDVILSQHPLVKHDSSLVARLKGELKLALERSALESSIRTIISTHEAQIDRAQQAENLELATKRKQFEQLLTYIKRYVRSSGVFHASLAAISQFSIKIITKEIESMGHKLFISNEFELTGDKFLEEVNNLLKPEHAIRRFEDITPESLFESKFRKRSPKVTGYDDFEGRVNARFAQMNKKNYRITTREGRDFDNLSAGWKTSVILDLILGWTGDNAPLIIDQPEDNLATRYINSGMLRAIKECKKRKQIILVSHNATIPMLGDAQNVVMCKNDNKRITIQSNPLEGAINGTDVVDLVAETTDGGKISVKKRVKKYNLKRFRGSDETSVQEG